jgi:hypothetical protein
MVTFFFISSLNGYWIRGFLSCNSWGGMRFWRTELFLLDSSLPSNFYSSHLVTYTCDFWDNVLLFCHLEYDSYLGRTRWIMRICAYEVCIMVYNFTGMILWSLIYFILFLSKFIWLLKFICYLLFYVGSIYTTIYAKKYNNIFNKYLIAITIFHLLGTRTICKL